MKKQNVFAITYISDSDEIHFHFRLVPIKFQKEFDVILNKIIKGDRNRFDLEDKLVLLVTTKEVFADFVQGWCPITKISKYNIKKIYGVPFFGYYIILDTKR